MFPITANVFLYNYKPKPNYIILLLVAKKYLLFGASEASCTSYALHHPVGCYLVRTVWASVTGVESQGLFHCSRIKRKLQCLADVNRTLSIWPHHTFCFIFSLYSINITQQTSYFQFLLTSCFFWSARPSRESFMLFFHFFISPPLLIWNLIKLLSACCHYCLCFFSQNISHFTVVFYSLSSHFFSKVGAMFVILVLAILISDRELDEVITWMHSHDMFSKFYIILAIFLCILCFIIVQF